jgi:redox-sensitive bicupin YhaK (pirin superfamily)
MSNVALTIVKSHARDLGGFAVRRILPAQAARTVGPFIFFDHLGPTVLAPGGIDVRPHPHIGLATVTFLFEGALMHRDSLGTVQKIVAGDVNWMTAGRGITHSERTAPEDRQGGMNIHGLQTWVALPRDQEECEPAFAHYPGADLPVRHAGGVTLRVLAGQLEGLHSPVATASPTLYAAIELAAGASMTLAADYAERAVYVAQGDLEIDAQAVPAGQMALLPQGLRPVLRSAQGARVMVLGGAPLDGERFIWWNFVSSQRARIETAKEDWRAGRFAGVPGETDFIPLPEH